MFVAGESGVVEVADRAGDPGVAVVEIAEGPGEGRLPGGAALDEEGEKELAGGESLQRPAGRSRRFDDRPGDAAERVQAETDSCTAGRQTAREEAEQMGTKAVRQDDDHDRGQRVVGLRGVDPGQELSLGGTRVRRDQQTRRRALGHGSRQDTDSMDSGQPALDEPTVALDGFLDGLTRLGGWRAPSRHWSSPRRRAPKRVSSTVGPAASGSGREARAGLPLRQPPRSPSRGWRRWRWSSTHGEYWRSMPGSARSSSRSFSERELGPGGLPGRSAPPPVRHGRLGAARAAGGAFRLRPVASRLASAPSPVGELP
ncbi:MAG: hypothetical protein R2862_09165 [Thermoanaerobaculia bacterium]